MDKVTSERINEATPNGGAYSIAYYLDKDDNPTDKSQAVCMEIVEFDKDDNEIFRTYGKLRKS